MKVITYKVLGIILELSSEKLFSLLARFLSFIFEEKHTVEKGSPSMDINSVVKLPEIYIRRVRYE